MRFTSIFTVTILALSALSGAAITRGLTGTAAVSDGNNRPSVQSGAVAAVTFGSGDTLMLGSTRDSVTVGSTGYKPWASSLFNAKIPPLYQYASSNKDSVVLCLTHSGDADTSAAAAVMQVRVAGTTNSTSVYVNQGSGTLTSLSTSTARTCLGFPTSRGLDFRFRLIGSGSSDSTSISRFEVYDK